MSSGSLTLQNDVLTIHMDLPEYNYLGARFDRTGKLTQVTYKGMTLLGAEVPQPNIINHGQGLYNEFGFKLPMGFEELKQGEWFHKIGVGLLQKVDTKYDFLKSYRVRPARFEVQASKEHITFICESDLSNGYAYVLKKTIRLNIAGWDIFYSLKNTGTKSIVTNEYTHNFITFNGAPTDFYYHLAFPFEIQPNLFDETINPEGLVSIGARDIKFLGKPTKPYFFSDMSGNKPVEAQWSLANENLGIGLCEKGNFRSKNVCLWGTGHVISPELFVDINIAPGETTTWIRDYKVFEL